MSLFTYLSATQLYIHSLHDALPIWHWNWWLAFAAAVAVGVALALLTERLLIRPLRRNNASPVRLLLLSLAVSQLLLSSEEHTSELQSHVNLVFRLLL